MTDGNLSFKKIESAFSAEFILLDKKGDFEQTDFIHELQIEQY